MGRKRKPSAEVTRYTYRFADRTEVTLTVGKDGVESSDILMLLAEDKEQQCSDRLEDIHKHGGFEEVKRISQSDQNKFDDAWETISGPVEQQYYCADDMQIPDAEQLLTFISRLTTEQMELIHKVFYEQKQVSEIAEEEGVSRAAIYNRLNKIYARIRKMHEEQQKNSSA